MAQYVFSMNHLTKTVPPKRQILKDISLSFFPGAKIGVLGLNGSGKSSLLKIMAGVDKEFEGEAIPMAGLSIGYLPQEPQLNPEHTVREAVEEAMAEVNKAGNFVPVIGKSATIAQGATPIVTAWDYNLLSWRDGLNGNPPVDVIIPEDGVVAGVYVQAISAYAPHPNAAKLWMEYLYSDEGQLGWLKGYCHPIRFNDLVKNGKVPAEMLDALPPAEAYEKAIFPTLEQQEANKKVVTEGWDKVVGAAVKE